MESDKILHLKMVADRAAEKIQGINDGCAWAEGSPDPASRDDLFFLAGMCAVISAIEGDWTPLNMYYKDYRVLSPVEAHLFGNVISGRKEAGFNPPGGKFILTPPPKLDNIQDAKGESHAPANSGSQGGSVAQSRVPDNPGDAS